MLWLVGFQIGLHSLAWLLASQLLRLERRALQHWALFMLLLGLGLVLGGWRGPERHWWAYNAVNLVTLIGFWAMRRGTELFCLTGRREREQLLLIAPFVLALLLLPPTLDWAAVRISTAYCGQALVMLAMMRSIAPRLRETFGLRTQIALLSACALFALVLLSLAALPWFDAGPAGEPPLDDRFHPALLYVFLGGSGCFGFAFLSLVILRQSQRLREAAQHDTLTGLFNRRAITERLQEQWLRQRRRRSPLALLMVDLDDIKQVNDRYGHHEGDAMLMRFAELLRRSVRAEDLVGRMGGGEFLLVLPDTPSPAAQALGERLRQLARVERLGCTLSLGLTLARPVDPGPEALIQRADQALHHAKSKGRDRLETV